MKEIIVAIVCGILAIIYLVISIMSFKEKVFCLITLIYGHQNRKEKK